MPSHVGIIAGVVLLLLMLIAGKFFARQLIEVKQEVVADTFVLLAAIV